MPPTRQGPLAGIRVIDHCSHWAGPLMCALMAGLGAEVIKVESIQRYDGSRLMRVCKPGPDSHEWSAAYNGYNHSKLGFTINLTEPAGYEIFVDLVRSSDIMVESYRPDSAARLGISYEQMQEINPRLIYQTLSGFGNQGPWAGRPGFGATFAQLAGFAYAHSYAGQPPNGDATIPYSDVFNAGISIYAAISALRQREVTGHGQFIDQAQIEVTALLGLPYLLDYSLNGRIHQPDGNRRPGPENVYPCLPGEEQDVIPAMAHATEGRAFERAALDEWIAIDIESDEDWAVFTHVAAGQPFASDARYETVQGRFAHRDQIDREIAAWTQQQGAMDLARRLQAAGIGAAPVSNHAQAMANEHFHDRGDIMYRERPSTGGHLFVGFPFHFEQPVTGWDTASPDLGQHNRVVLQEILGMSDEQVAQLEADEIIGEKPVWHPVT